MATLPRVTEILRAVGLAKTYPDTPGMVYARERGRALHRAIELHAQGILDEQSVHPAIRPGFEAYLRFRESAPEPPWVTELALEHQALGYQGHLDSVGPVRGIPAVVDWKWSDGDLFAARYQLAAYGLLWAANDTRPVERRYAVILGSGRPEIHDLTDAYAETVFTAAVVVYRAREGRR